MGQEPSEAPLSGPHKSGDVDWSLLSPRGDNTKLNPILALHLRRAASGHTAPAMASTEVGLQLEQAFCTATPGL